MLQQQNHDGNALENTMIKAIKKQAERKHILANTIFETGHVSTITFFKKDIDSIWRLSVMGTIVSKRYSLYELNQFPSLSKQ